MKKGVSLFEMILVLVILSILLATGSIIYRPRHLINDSHYITLKIAQAQYKGLGFDHRDGKGGSISANEDIGCLTLTKEDLEEKATKGKAPYRIHSTLSGELAGKRLCFDHLGRPSLDDPLHPIHSIQELKINYNNTSRTLLLFPFSGYVIILD